MPLYHFNKEDVALIKTTQFKKEKDLQNLVEKNLPEIFGCQLVASEYKTGDIHSGRIDTLALSEDANPVIIEYKKVQSSELVNQSLYYLSWLVDHKGDFELAVHKTLGVGTEVDWSNIRVICIAPGYKKFDLHAVRQMGDDIELYEYKLYENNTFTLEEVNKKTTTLVELGSGKRKKSPNKKLIKPVEPEALLEPEYDIETHLAGKSTMIQELYQSLSEFIINLDESVEEVPKKHYIAYKLNKNFVCLEIQQRKIYLYLKIDPAVMDPIPKGARDVRKIGHYGTGDLEYTVKKGEDLPMAFELIRKAMENIGG